MMKEFAAHVEAATGKKYNWKERKIKYVNPQLQILELIINWISQLPRACH